MINVPMLFVVRCQSHHKASDNLEPAQFLRYFKGI